MVKEGVVQVKQDRAESHGYSLSFIDSSAWLNFVIMTAEHDRFWCTEATPGT